MTIMICVKEIRSIKNNTIEDHHQGTTIILKEITTEKGVDHLQSSLSNTTVTKGK